MTPVEGWNRKRSVGSDGRFFVQGEIFQRKAIDRDGLLDTPVTGGERGLDPRSEQHADEENGASGQHEVGEIQQISDYGEEQVPRESPEKDGDQVPVERITACRTEDPEDIERYERNQRGEPYREKGRFHEIVNSALVDIAFACPPDSGILKSEVDGTVVHEAGDQSACNGGNRNRDRMIGPAKVNQRRFVRERNEGVGGNAVEEEKRKVAILRQQERCCARKGEQARRSAEKRFPALAHFHNRQTLSSVGSAAAKI